ncbi:MAG: hypothetical protein PHP64_08680 [Actinomycetota bacterium]|nr:hypothetical protein [Actinomycetota bacterium]
MEMKEIQNFFDGLSLTLDELFGEVYETLVMKGKKRLGQKDVGETPQISELIKRTHEEHSIAELVSKGKEGQEELIQAIGGQVRKALSSLGIVTKSDLERIERRMAGIEKALSEKGK